MFCAVLAWSRFRFVRFAADEKAATTLAMLAECFEVLGGVPKIVLADRMGCLKAGVVANVVVPTPDYVRFATHYGFRPDFCQAADPESKGIVENLVGYAKRDLMVPRASRRSPTWRRRTPRPRRGAPRSTPWCIRRSARSRPSGCEPSGSCCGRCRRCGPRSAPKPITRKVDKLSCIRFGSARYSVPNRLIGTTVTAHRRRRAGAGHRAVHRGGLAEHALVAPGETSIVDDHYGRPAPDKPRRAPRPRTAAEKAFLALGPVAEAFLTGAAAAGVSQAGRRDRRRSSPCVPPTAPTALLAALERAVAFGRWRAADVRSILATDGARTRTSPRRAGPGADAADGADPVAGGLPHRRR